VLSLLGQQQQFHFAFGQRPFHFSTDPLSGFRMPPIGNCQSKYTIVPEKHAIYFILLESFSIVKFLVCREINPYSQIWDVLTNV